MPKHKFNFHLLDLPLFWYFFKRTGGGKFFFVFLFMSAAFLYSGQQYSLLISRDLAKATMLTTDAIPLIISYLLSLVVILNIVIFQAGDVFEKDLESKMVTWFLTKPISRTQYFAVVLISQIAFFCFMLVAFNFFLAALFWYSKVSQWYLFITVQYLMIPLVIFYVCLNNLLRLYLPKLINIIVQSFGSSYIFFHNLSPWIYGNTIKETVTGTVNSIPDKEISDFILPAVGHIMLFGGRHFTGFTFKPEVWGWITQILFFSLLAALLAYRKFYKMRF